MGHFSLFFFGKSNAAAPTKVAVPAYVDLMPASSAAAPATGKLVAKRDSSRAELDELKALSGVARTAAMSAGNKVWTLAFQGHAQEILTLLSDLSPEQQVQILDQGNNLEAMIKQGAAKEIYALIKSYAPEQQGKLLAKAYIIPNYLSDTKEAAAEVVGLLKAMQPETQTRVMAINHVVYSLSRKGYAMEVFDMIAHLDINQKARIRVAKGYDEVMSYCSRRSADRQPKNGVTPAFKKAEVATPVSAA